MMGCPICNSKPANCDCTETEREQFEEIQELQCEIARLRESLAIFVHAHSTGNSVPPHIESKAMSLVKEVGRE